jgi:hypothetical protein
VKDVEKWDHDCPKQCVKRTMAQGFLTEWRGAETKMTSKRMLLNGYGYPRQYFKGKLHEIFLLRRNRTGVV